MHNVLKRQKIFCEIFGYSLKTGPQLSGFFDAFPNRKRVKKIANTSPNLLLFRFQNLQKWVILKETEIYIFFKISSKDFYKKSIRNILRLIHPVHFLVFIKKKHPYIYKVLKRST